MRFRRCACLLSLLFAVLIARPPSAQAGWIWSPQTGWVGPSGAVKDTPEEQLAHAAKFFEQPDYDRARVEFEKLVKHYKHSPQAAEAQYFIGRCREAQADYYAAFLAYRKTVQVYPSTARFEEILEREYQLGNYFLGGKKRRVLGMAAILPARDKAVEIFQAIVEDGPFSEYGELAQYKLGIAHMALGDYEPAVSAFEQLIERYPESALVDDAKFQLAQASLKGTFRPQYDQSPAKGAIKELEEFVRKNPASDLSAEALERLQTLRQRRAQHDFEVAQFYEKRRAYDAALVYYENIVQDYAETDWAGRALARIQILEPLLNPRQDTP